MRLHPERRSAVITDVPKTIVMAVGRSHDESLRGTLSLGTKLPLEGAEIIQQRLKETKKASVKKRGAHGMANSPFSGSAAFVGCPENRENLGGK